MARHVRATFYSRKSLRKLLNELEANPPSKWPLYIYQAWSILSAELGVPDDQSIGIVLDCVSSAHRLFDQENEQICSVEELRVLRRIAQLFLRLSRCARRAPSALRSDLDARVLPLVRGAVIDLEVIESIFGAVKTAFEEVQECEPTRTALKSIEEINCANLSVVRITFRKDLEQAMLALVDESSSKRSTVTVRLLDLLADAIADQAKTLSSSTKAHTLRTQYACKIVQIWRNAGLKPARARSDFDETYESKFQRFGELVLDGLINLTQRQSELRPINTQPRPIAHRYEWRLSEDYIRTALGS